MVEPGDDDFVARAPVLGQRAGEVVGQLRHAAAEDDAVRAVAEQVGRGKAGFGDDVLRATLGGGDRAAVRDRRTERRRDGFADDVRDLRTARAVEMCGAFGECGEVLTDLDHVIRHLSRMHPAHFKIN